MAGRAPGERHTIVGGDPAMALRFKALSADSYRLDSPPFTGAAVTGAGPVTQALGESVEEVKAINSGVVANDDVPAWLLDKDEGALSDNESGGSDTHEVSFGMTPAVSEPRKPRSPFAAPVPRQSQTADAYEFPRHRLPERMRDESKTPLVIVACGSFSPPTYLHLRMFEMAKDQVIESGHFELLSGYYSPVSDQYKKEGLAKGTHRVRMCELAVERSSNWLMVDAWESLQGEYQRTAVVLDHFDAELNGNGGILMSDGSRRPIKIMLLAGGDLIQSMGEPGVWADADLHHILGRFGCLIIERTGADVWSFLLSHDLLWMYRRNLIVVKQTIYNDISSSKVRLFVKRGYSIKYLLPNSVIQYIEQNGLYKGMS